LFIIQRRPSLGRDAPRLLEAAFAVLNKRLP
jgi:hypothetical protein